MTSTAVAHAPTTPLWRRWPDWVAYAAAAWSIVHAGHWRMTLAGSFPLGDFGDLTLENAWAALLPELIWPLWGVALAAAALAYYLRRRERCQVCGRGSKARPTRGAWTGPEERAT